MNIIAWLIFALNRPHLTTYADFLNTANIWKSLLSYKQGPNLLKTQANINLKRFVNA